MNSTLKKRLILILVLLIASAIYALTIEKDNKHNKVAAETIDKIELPASITSRQEQVITHTGYTVSHNSQWCIPNWVAYELTAEETLGEVSRGDDFVPDPDVRGRSANTNDYKHSGYDRGHMAPAADMKWSEVAMYESFYMSNICPQNKNLNKGDWKELEELGRDWAMLYNSIYIVCGPIVESDYKTIGENEVAIPKAFFKVFLRKTNDKWSAIGFYFENKAGNKDLKTYVKTIDEIETIADIDFFPLLPDDVEDDIESKLNIGEWEM